MWTDLRTLKISDIGLSENASHAFHSMLKIVQGRSVAFWQSSDIAHADVLLVEPGNHAAVINAWGLTGKPLVLLTDDRSITHETTFALSYPFRVMQLLSMLDNVADYLRDHPAHAAADNASAWDCALSLRRLCAPPSADDWYVAQSADGCSVWTGDGCARAPQETLERLRRGELTLGAFSTATTLPPTDSARCALPDFAWLVGLQCAHKLAPWLRHDAAYRLHRWPDFGRLGAPAHLIELAAQLAIRAQTPSMLIQHTDSPAADVYRFTAGASMAGWLLPDFVSSNEKTGAGFTQPIRIGWLQLMKNLRRRIA